jgi:hypothetical protein
MRNRKDLPAMAICLCCSLLLLVLSLLCGVRLTAVNDLAAERMRRAEQLRQENARLRARCESSLSLEEIESYAVHELGMQRLSAEQIVVVEEPIR